MGRSRLFLTGLFAAASILINPNPATACVEGTLRERVNEASALVSSGSPVAALVCYEATASSEALRNNDSPQLEERLLFEYHDAAQRAAALIPDKRVFYLQRVADVADSYIQFYRVLDPQSLQSLKKNHQDRISNVLFDLANAYEALGQKDEILNALEQYTDDAIFFTPRIRKLWEKTLRSFPKYDHECTDAQVIKDMQQDEQIALHWKAYRDFLVGFEKVRNMKREAQQAQARLRHIFTALG